MQNDHLSFDGLSCKPISFSRSSAGSGRHYRGSTKACSSLSLAADNSIIDGSESVLFSAPLKHLNPKARSLSAIDIALSADYPKSKAPVSVMSCLTDDMPCLTDDNDDMDLCGTDDDDANQTGAGAELMIPPSLAAHSASRFCNDVNSLLVPSATCEEVASQVSRMLWSTYPNDIDVKVDFSPARQQVEGLVFISNMCVDFALNLWDEAPDSTRIEFRRTSGDAMAAAQLWATIQASLMPGHSPDTDSPKQSSDCCFLSLDLNMDDFADTLGLPPVVFDLDALARCLVENDLFVVHELQSLCDALKNGKVEITKVLSHKTLMRALIDSSLLNKDVSVTRCVLLLLEQLAAQSHGSTEMKEVQGRVLGADSALFDNIALLLKHQRSFIRKSCLRLLSSLLLLSSLTRQCVWYADRASKQRMIDNVTTCAAQLGGEHADDSFRAMIVQIDDTLAKM